MSITSLITMIGLGSYIVGIIMIFVQFTAILIILWDWYWESREVKVQKLKTIDLRKTRWQLQKELENPRAKVTKETLERMRGYGSSEDLLSFIESIRQDK